MLCVAVQGVGVRAHVCVCVCVWITDVVSCAGENNEHLGTCANMCACVHSDQIILALAPNNHNMYEHTLPAHSVRGGHDSILCAVVHEPAPAVLRVVGRAHRAAQVPEGDSSTRGHTVHTREVVGDRGHDTICGGEIVKNGQKRAWDVLVNVSRVGVLLHALCGVRLAHSTARIFEGGQWHPQPHSPHSPNSRGSWESMQSETGKERRKIRRRRVTAEAILCGRLSPCILIYPFSARGVPLACTSRTECLSLIHI